MPGRFVSRGDGTIFADSSASPLTRLRDASLRASNRAASKAQCVAKFGAVTGQCTFTGDPDEVPSDCDCDEYPFAATNEGAAFGNVSVKRIDASDNRRAGSFLGNFYLNQRVLDGDPFFVEVGSASAKRWARQQDRAGFAGLYHRDRGARLKSRTPRFVMSGTR